MIILGTNSIKETGYDVANSCRFDGSSSKLVKAQSAGNRDLWTYSVWIKWSAITTTTTTFFTSSDGSNLYAYMGIQSYKLRFLDYNSDNQTNLITNRLFRDPSAWYHIVLAYDSAQGTDSNRVKLYVNGVQETSFSTETYPSSGLDSAVNVNSSNFIISSNQEQSSGSMWNGYMAESCFIDGTAYAATDFGEFDEDSGIWKPISVSGLTFGTNGFYLDFEDSANLGNDANGGTDFTETGLAATDQSTDTCTNNFATLNPLNANIGATVPTLSEGNLRTSNSITNKMQTQYSTLAPSTGKFYCEVKATAGSVFRIGISSYNSNQAQGSSDTQNRPGQFSEGWGYDKTGTIYKTESSIATYTAYNTGDIICIALDMTNKKLYFRRNNNAWENSANLATGSNGIDISSIPSGTGMAFGAGLEAGSVGAAYADFNFGSPPFSISSGNTDGNGYGNMEYAIPSGYYVLNSKNLAEFG